MAATEKTPVTGAGPFNGILTWVDQRFPLVSLWKGLAKPLALAGVAVAALAGFFHYTRVGPNEVTEEDELVAAREADEAKHGRNEERS